MAEETPQTEQRVSVRSPDGVMGSVPASSLQDAIEAGYEVQSAEQVAAHRAKAKYNDSEIAAAAAGVARGATLGLSDLALTQSGLVEPETLKGLKDYNPYTSAGSELVGNIAPALIPGGGVAGTAAKIAPARLASAAGEGVAKLATKGAARALGVAGEDIAASAIGRGLTTGVGSAVEGALYGAGQAVSEDALGDTDLNAESFMTHVGLGALFGGVLGGGIGAASGAVSGIRGRLANRLDDAMPQDAAAMADEAALSSRGETLAGDLSGEGPMAQPTSGGKNIEHAVGGELPSAEASPQSFARKILDSDIGDGVVRQISTIADVPEEAVKDFLTSSQARASINVANRVRDEAIPKLESDFNFVRRAKDIITGEAKGELKADNVRRIIRKGNEEEVAQRALEVVSRVKQRVDDMLADVDRYGNKNALIKAQKAIKVYTGDIERAMGKQEIGSEFQNAASEFRNTMPGAPSAHHNADIFIAIDRLKRVLGSKDLSKFGSFLSSADNATALELRDIYQQELMPFLEERALWGEKAADMQRVVNHYWNLDLQQDAEAQKLFFKDIGKDAEGRIRDADSQKIGAHINDLSDPRNNTANRQMNYWLDSSTGLLKAIKEHYALEGANAQIVDDAVKAVSSIRSTMAEVDKTVVRANQMRKIMKAMPWTSRGLNAVIAGESVMSSVFRLGKIERAVNRVNTRIKDSVDEFVKGGEQRAEAAGSGAARTGTAQRTAAQAETAVPTGKRGSVIYPMVGAASTLFGNLERRRHYRENGDTDRVGRYKMQVKALQRAYAHPELVQQQLAHNLQPLQQAAPKMTVAMTVRGNQALQFLYSKIAPGQPNPALPGLATPYRPTEDEVTSFERYARVVNDPMTAIDDLKARRLSFEAVEGLKAVYPKLYDTVVKQAAQAVASTDRPMPYRDRIQLSLLLGQPLDPTLQPDYLTMVQSASPGGGAPNGPASQGGVPPSGSPKLRTGGLGKNVRAGNLTTPGQRLAEDNA